ncbi:ADP-ribosylglycohydrolase family protein [Tessaracoccus antarcticus]|uniref:ADP-ribosylglycohydrolase family protein n=1 Tax=Tessaracoccus antarcticus TaxID=2479848 RepID=A0A3M0GCY3_9ACTN|nr:ADP-ribosylglycohydrolase family protein [Tessaracoccus antarcticus]
MSVNTEFLARAEAVVVGVAVADALGGATEGWTPEQIRQRHGGPVTGIVGPYNREWATARPIAPYHKGDGHITDDTLMTNLLIDVYAERRTHLDAYAMADGLVPLMISKVVWIPELERETIPLQRVFLAEKYLVQRLHYGHVDPREAGVGNIVNCGAAMYMAPVGVVNAGDPWAAYAEAIDMAGAHQLSYGREAAGVFAGAVAAALTPGATPESVIEAAMDLSHDGTRTAIGAVVAAARQAKPGDDLNEVLRAAVAPYDSVGPDYRNQSMEARRPSRIKSIEELPVALGFVLAAGGDYREAVLGAINYGRDADSIAVMAGAICAALQGLDGVPDAWVTGVSEGSRLDLHAAGKVLGEVAVEILRRDADRARQRLSALERMGMA